MKANKARKTYIRSFFIGATITTVLILHFVVSQFFFYEESAEDFIVDELTIEQPVKIKLENEMEKAETVNITEDAPESVQPVPKIKVKQPDRKETETVNRKNPPRESRAQRLRRVERILTGI